MMRRQRVGLSCAAVLLVAACGGSQPSTPMTPKATTSGGPTLTGKKVSITMLQGHPVVLVFWGSWCGPCHREQPELNSMYAQWSPRGVDFLGIDLRDDNAKALVFQSQFSVPYPSIADSVMTIAIHYRIPSAPALVFLDRHGSVDQGVLGGLDVMSVADFNAEITRLLGAPGAIA
jgi:thiol-disulfide isomerase/thioredoxin